jgi:hypothetical protein
VADLLGRVQNGVASVSAQLSQPEFLLIPALEIVYSLLLLGTGSFSFFFFFFCTSGS